MHTTSNNTFASTIWNLLQEHKVILPAGFEQATIWLLVIDNSKLKHLYVQPSVQGRSTDSFPEQRLVIKQMVWIPNGLNKLPKVHFKFCFIFVGKSTMAFLTGQSWRILKSWYSAGDPEQGFWRCFPDGLNKSWVMSLTQADAPQVSTLKSVKSPTHQWLFKSFSMHLTICSSVNIQLSTTEISKVLESCLMEVFSFQWNCSSRKPTYNGLFPRFSNTTTKQWI